MNDLDRLIRDLDDDIVDVLYMRYQDMARATDGPVPASVHRILAALRDECERRYWRDREPIASAYRGESRDE